MLAYFPLLDLVINTAAIKQVYVTGRTDQYHNDHVIIKFIDGDFYEFDPEVSLHYVWTVLTDKEQ